MTYLIIAVNVAVWLVVQGAGVDAAATWRRPVCNLGMVPGELTHLAPLGTLRADRAGHGLHRRQRPHQYPDPADLDVPARGVDAPDREHALPGGLRPERRGQPWGGAVSSLSTSLCGLVAAATHIAFNATSPVPTVGSVGCDLRRARGVPRPLSPTRPCACSCFSSWSGFARGWCCCTGSRFRRSAGSPQLNELQPSVSGGTAVWAHVGGFLAGVILARPFVNQTLLRAQQDEWRRECVS